MTEILFIVEEDATGYRARAVGADIVTQGHTRDEVTQNVRNAIVSHFDPSADAPKVAHLHFVHDVTIAVATDPQGDSARREEVVRNLKGTVLQDLDPYGPATPIEDWEAAR